MQILNQTERQGSDLIGMPVISIDNGLKLGQVTALLVRSEEEKVTAFRIGTELAPGPAIPFANIRLVGVDVLLVDSAQSLELSFPTEMVRELDDALPGRSVLTASGERIGTVSGFRMNTMDGKITGYNVRPEAGVLSRLTNFLHHDTFEVQSGQIVGLGKDALIVTDTVRPIPS